MQYMRFINQVFEEEKYRLTIVFKLAFK